MNPYLITTNGIHKKYQKGSFPIHVLKDICFSVKKHEFVSIMGPSGSGKSTLLHILGCLDRPTSGTYSLDGIDVLKASDRELSHIRASHIGFVFQMYNLLPELSVFENVALPFLYSSKDSQYTKDRATTAIEQVDLIDRIDHRPSELSGGEMQRVAIARALAIEPKLILADEPTGNLDSRSGKDILRLFQALHSDGATIIMVTHDLDVASYAQKSMTLRDGRFVENPL